MNRFSKSLATTFLSASMLFTSAAQAMEIIQFDQMTAQDRQALAEGARFSLSVPTCFRQLRCKRII
jgi:hypothetical protein